MRFGCSCVAGVLAIASALSLPVAAAVPASVPQWVDHGRFQHVPVQLPDSSVQRVVVWFHQADSAQALQPRLEALRRDGALVVAVHTQQLRAALKREGGSDCGFGAGDVENFSRWLQAYLHLPGYRLPVLGGDGEGASLAYALAAQAGPGVFAGLLTTDFDPERTAPGLACGTAVAQGRLRPVTLSLPWLDAAGAGKARAFQQGIASARRFRKTADGDATPGLLAAARVIGAASGVSVAPPPPALEGLPVVEVPARQAGDTLAIFVSGDGGWAGLDKAVAAALAVDGVSVVGVDSLRYFWTARTPAGFAADLARIAGHYQRQWQRPRLLLLGFSQGADVLPASINQMDPALRAQVQLIVLMSVGRKAEFEFHVSNWLGSSDAGLPIAPEVLHLPMSKTLCIYGREDTDALCPDLPVGSGVRTLELPGDHHFDGDHARLAREILNAARAW